MKIEYLDRERHIGEAHKLGERDMTAFSRIDAFLASESTLGSLKRNFKMCSLQIDLGQIIIPMDYLGRKMIFEHAKAKRNSGNT